MGSKSKPVKTSSIGAPSSASTISATRSAEMVGTESCSFTSASMYAGGSRSVRADATWPSLIMVGPRRSSSFVTHAATTACFTSSLRARRIFHVATIENVHSFRERRSGLPRLLAQRSSMSSPVTAAGAAVAATFPALAVETTTPCIEAVSIGDPASVASITMGAP